MLAEGYCSTANFEAASQLTVHWIANSIALRGSTADKLSIKELFLLLSCTVGVA